MKLDQIRSDQIRLYCNTLRAQKNERDLEDFRGTCLERERARGGGERGAQPGRIAGGLSRSRSGHGIAFSAAGSCTEATKLVPESRGLWVGVAALMCARKRVGEGARERQRVEGLDGVWWSAYRGGVG